MTQASSERSERPANAPAVVRASERLWGLRWPSWRFGDIAVEIGSFDEALPFIKEHYGRIFASEPGRFLEEKLTPAKLRFFGESDVFLFRTGERVVGIWIGHPSDWATYYARTMAILPDYRGRGFFNDFFTRITAALQAAGVERIESDTAPANIPVNRGFLRLGWIVTASVNTDRWGTVLRYTKFLTPESEQCFRRQFLIVPALSAQGTCSSPASEKRSTP